MCFHIIQTTHFTSNRNFVASLQQLEKNMHQTFAIIKNNSKATYEQSNYDEN